jgi:hypothetical protein
MSTLTVEKIPVTIDEYLAIRDRLSSTPEGGAVLMAVALIAYTKDEALGRQCLTVAVDRDRLVESADGYKGFALAPRELANLKDRILRQPHVARSYVRGTGPAGRYEFPSAPLAFEVTTNPYSGDKATGTYKVFLASTGADSPRPITLKRNDKGIWKASEWSSLTLGVRPPAATVSDDL